MKRLTLLLFTIFLLDLLTACTNNTSTQELLSDEDKVATIVAGTLSAIPTNTSTPTETPTPEASPTPMIQCKGEYSRVVLTMPNASWNCSVGVLQDGVEILNISSSVFEIKTGYGLGRGLWCEPNRDQNCVVTPFYENNLVELSLYKWYGESKEIFGIIKLANTPIPLSLSIKYLDMEKREITKTEMQELLLFVDMIRFE